MVYNIIDMGFLQKQPWQPRTLMDVDVIALANGIRPGGGREEECLTQARNVLDLADRFAPGLKEGGWIIGIIARLRGS